jgi:hypothetical protein
MSRTQNWVDVLDKELDSVVLVKGNRLQVIVHPTQKQLRRRGKRNWSLAAEVSPAGQTNGEGVLSQELQEAVLAALAELTGGRRAKKKKAGRAARQDDGQ